MPAATPQAPRLQEGAPIPPAELIEQQLHIALAAADDERCPPNLRQALDHAVFSGGGRFRPKLCLAVADACGVDSATALPAAAAIELMHCASLVHDDLACFDNADIRRGKPSVRRLFGENIAVLTGDTLIVLAFRALAAPQTFDAEGMASALRYLADATGVPGGIAAGQAWETVDGAQIGLYHDAKTGSLFAGATALGALAAKADPDAWHPVGMAIGRCYQAIDDILDVAAPSTDIGKPAGQDARLARPNLALSLGLEAAIGKARELIDAASDSVPACRKSANLKMLIKTHLKRALGPACALEPV